MTSRSRDERVGENSGHGRMRSAEDSRRHVCCAEAVWLPREQRASVCRDGRGQFLVRDGTSSQAMTTAATAHGRGGRHGRCCAREPKANENTELQRRNLQREQDANHLTQQQATLQAKGTSLRRKIVQVAYRAMRALRQTGNETKAHSL